MVISVIVKALGYREREKEKEGGREKQGGRVDMAYHTHSQIIQMSVQSQTQ